MPLLPKVQRLIFIKIKHLITKKNLSLLILGNLLPQSSTVMRSPPSTVVGCLDDWHYIAGRLPVKKKLLSFPSHKYRWFFSWWNQRLKQYIIFVYNLPRIRKVHSCSNFNKLDYMDKISTKIKRSISSW